MSRRYHLVAFDLDDTLAPSKSPLPAQMGALLIRLLERVEVCVISGGNFAQFRMQLLDGLGAGHPELLERLHLMPTCGTQYYRYGVGDWVKQYEEDLSDAERSAALAVLEEEAKRLGYWEPDRGGQVWGDILEDRGSQVTFSALGQRAPVAVKREWDPSDEKKNRLRDAVAARLPDLEVRSGGSTSVDITRLGIDKAYGMQRLSELTGIGLDEMLFIGDRLDPAGNDYPVKALGVPTRAVHGWEDTLGVIEELLSSGAVPPAAAGVRGAYATGAATGRD